MSCNRSTQTLRRINESMPPDFSLSLLPLLFFCPFLFGVNEPRNERDSRSAGASANGGPRRGRRLDLVWEGDIESTCCVPHRGGDIHRSYPYSSLKNLHYFQPTISMPPKFRIRYQFKYSNPNQNWGLFSTHKGKCNYCLSERNILGDEDRVSDWPGAEFGAEQRYLTIVSCVHSLALRLRGSQSATMWSACDFTVCT